MPACSIDALIALDPGALDDAELKTALCDFARARARFDAAEAEAIAEFDQRGCYADDGAVNAPSWLAHHTGVPRAAAGSRVLLAKRLRRMPLMAIALEAGRVSAAHARALGRCLTPRTLEAFARDEELLVEKAVELDADDFEKVVTRWLQLNDEDGPDPGGEKPSEFRASRHFGGRGRLDGDLDLEDTTEFLAELDEIYDELWREDQAADDSDPLKTRTRAQRNAAALAEMSRRSRATRGAGPEADEHGPHPRRPQLITLVDIEALAGSPGGLAELEDGTILPRDLLERWACDCSIGRVVMKGGSIPFDLGKVTYTPSPGQRRALITRDRGCIVPGCKRKPRWCEAHHVVRWPDGPTDLANLVLLCNRHHKHVHSRVIRLIRDVGTERWRVVRGDGTPLRERPPPALAA